MEKVRKYFVKFIIITLIIMIFYGIYYINCALYNKEFLNDLIYIRLINSVKNVSGDYFIYDEFETFVDDSNTCVYAIIFEDNAQSQGDYKSAIQELKAIKDATEEFLDKNPHYFPKGSKIEIVTNNLYYRTWMMNHIDGVVYDDFVKLMVFDDYNIVDVADNFADIKYLYFEKVIEEIEVIDRFTKLEILAMFYHLSDSSEKDIINAIHKKYPNLEIRDSFDYE